MAGSRRRARGAHSLVGGTAGRLIPVPPPDTDKIIIVSPFVDKTFLARQKSVESNSTQRVLLTTMREIERAGPLLSGFDDLLVLDAPDYPARDPLPDAEEGAAPASSTVEADEEEEIGRGLHAKLLFMRSRQRRRLWLGSANATMRAWSGRNVEVMAQLLINEGVEKGLMALLGSARNSSPHQRTNICLTMRSSRTKLSSAHVHRLLRGGRRASQLRVICCF